MYILFIHSSIKGHLGYFHLLAIVNNVTMNIGVKISVWIPDFNYFRYLPRNGIAGSYANSMINFLWTTTLFFTAAAPFYIPTSNAQGFQISSYPCWHLLFTLKKKNSILMGVKWNLTVVLICISLVILSTFLCVCWPLVYVLWRNVYSHPLSTL